MVELLNSRTGKTLIKNLSIRTTFLDRLTGYMMVPFPEKGSGILMLNTTRIHTSFMKFPLDIIYLDRALKIIRTTRNVPGFRFPSPPSGCRHIVEAPHGGLGSQSDLKTGDRLSIMIRISVGTK